MEQCQHNIRLKAWHYVGSIPFYSQAPKPQIWTAIKGPVAQQHVLPGFHVM